MNKKMFLMMALFSVAGLYASEIVDVSFYVRSDSFKQRGNYYDDNKSSLSKGGIYLPGKTFKTTGVTKVEKSCYLPTTSKVYAFFAQEEVPLTIFNTSEIITIALNLEENRVLNYTAPELFDALRYATICEFLDNNENTVHDNTQDHYTIKQLNNIFDQIATTSIDSKEEIKQLHENNKDIFENEALFQKYKERVIEVLGLQDVTRIGAEDKKAELLIIENFEDFTNVLQEKYSDIFKENKKIQKIKNSNLPEEKKEQLIENKKVFRVSGTMLGGGALLAYLTLALFNHKGWMSGIMPGVMQRIQFPVNLNSLETSND